MIKYIKSAGEFNKANSAAWEQNFQYWGTVKKRDENYSITTKQLMGVIRDIAKMKHSPVIIDAGCGHGWILDSLINTPNLDFKYFGLDYTKGFIDMNSENYKSQKNAKFMQFDLTSKELSPELAGIADIVINYMNLIEVWDIDSVFRNMSKMLKVGGHLAVITADTLSKIASLSTDKADYNKNFVQYANRDETIGYEENILDKEQKPTGRIFHNVGHYISTYLNAAVKHGLNFVDMKEIYRTEWDNPQIELIMQFQKQK